MRDRAAYALGMLALACVVSIIFCVTALAADGPEGTVALKTIKLTVPDANCASTGAEADSMLRGMDGVASVMLDIEEATAVVSYDPKKITVEDMKKVLVDGGYPVTAAEEIEQ